MVSLECDTSVFLFPLLPTAFALPVPSACSPHRDFCRQAAAQALPFRRLPLYAPPHPQNLVHRLISIIPFSMAESKTGPRLPPTTPEFKRRSRCTLRHAPLSHTPVNKAHPTPMDACLSHWQLMRPVHPCSGVILTSSTCHRNHQAPSQSGARPLFGAVLIHIVLTMIVLGILGTVRLSSVTIVVSHSRTPWARRSGRD